MIVNAVNINTRAVVNFQAKRASQAKPTAFAQRRTKVALPTTIAIGT